MGAHSSSYKLLWQRMQSNPALLLSAPARWLAGSVADARCVIWQIKQLACLGIPAAKGAGRRDVIAPNVARYCELECERESSARDA